MSNSLFLLLFLVLSFFVVPRIPDNKRSPRLDQFPNVFLLNVFKKVLKCS